MTTFSDSAVAQLANLTGNVFVDGSNFSGRTDLLKSATHWFTHEHTTNRRRAYAPPEVHNGISGLAHSLKMELQLSRADEYAELAALIASTPLARLQERNPFTLSGGEQALLAIVTALASGRNACAIDCAAEQLDQANRSLLFQWMEEYPPYDGGIRLIADNRLSGEEFPGRVILAPTQAGYHLLEPEMMQVPHIKPTRIGVKDLSFRYNNASDWVFHDCSFDLEPGKPYILKGPNGSGKSTLAKLLTGVLRPSEGCITRDGLKVDIWKQPGSLVGYHFQNPDLQLFCSSVAEELRPPQWVPKGFFDVLVRTFGLTHVLASHPLDLPFVLRKRVGLASTVSMVRPWFIFDEPVLAQDKTSAKAVATILKHLLAAQAGLIIVSHFEWFDRLFDAIQLCILQGKVIMGNA